MEDDGKNGILTIAASVALYYILKEALKDKGDITDLEKRLGSESTKKNGLHDNYGFIISCDTESRHRENISLACDTLVGSNWIKKENLYVLDDRGEKRAEYPVDGPATKNAVEAVFAHLVKKVDNKDVLFLYVTGHGSNMLQLGGSQGIRTVAALPTSDGAVTEENIEKWLDRIEAKIGLLLFDQCYGGDIAYKTGNGKYIAVSAADRGESSNDNTFPQQFFKAFRSFIADLDGDGRVSIGEIFEYARRTDLFARSGDQRPQIYSEINPKGVIVRQRE